MKSKNEQIWLFFFADLAFLLMIAFTQTSTIGKKPVSIGEMTIPMVVDSPSISSITPREESYQIRVYRPSDTDMPPYQIVTITGDNPAESQLSSRMHTKELKENLSRLKLQGKQRPILVPDKLSLSKDMLMAMSIMEKVWSESNKVIVKRVAYLSEKMK
jgi:hypothetical protein